MRLSKFIRDNTIFPKDIVSQLVGHLLGNGALRINGTSVSPREAPILDKVFTN